MTIRKQGILLFCILMFCYAFVHQRLGWNQNSRLDLLKALVLYGTFKIDAHQENTGDKSVHNGHYYSDKAPGTVFLALPAFTVSVVILNSLDIPLESPRGLLISSWITTVGALGWITALGGVTMFVFLCKLVGQRYAFVSTIAVFVGSSPFPYATMLYSHAAVIGLICIALCAIGDDCFLAHLTSLTREEAHLASTTGCLGPANSVFSKGSAFVEPRFWLRRHILAGFCCGLAISSEYTSATAAGGVLALALLTKYKRGLVMAFAAIPPLLLIPLYNWVCFGGPLAFGYHHLALAQFQRMDEGLFGVTFPPKASAAYLVLLSPERGLFFWTPFFLMALVGLKPLWKASRRLFWVSNIVILIHVLCISGYYMPNGGSVLGPRHLAPIIPFVMIVAALGLRQYFFVGYVYGFLSLMLTGMSTLIGMPPHNILNPLMLFYLPRLLGGEFTNNLAYYMGVPLYLSFVPFFILVTSVYIWARNQPGNQQQVV